MSTGVNGMSERSVAEVMAEARRDIEAALDMLNRPQSAPEIMYRIAASMIVSALTPANGKSAGSEYYRIKAEDWMTLLLSEPRLSPTVLLQRVSALAAVSDTIKSEIGGIASRLALALEVDRA